MSLKKYFNYLLVSHLVLLIAAIIYPFFSRFAVPAEVYEMGKGTANIVGIIMLFVALILTFVGNIALFYKSIVGFFCFAAGNVLGLLSLVFFKWIAVTGIANFLGEAPLFLAAIIITIYIYEWYSEKMNF